MNTRNKDKELSEEEGIRRLKEKAKDMKDKQIVPPVDEDEPAGLLSGGPEHLDLDEEESGK